MRGFDSSDLKIIDAEWSAALTDALALGDEDTRAAISTYRALADTQNGLPALKVACGGFLVGIVADEADYISRQAA